MTAPGRPSVRDVGERALLDELVRIANGGAGAGEAILVGPGDDAAVIATGPQTVMTTDAAVQDRHFRLGWSTAEDIGRRVIVQNAADVAAMSGRPTAFVAVVGCPPDTPADLVLGMSRGMVSEAARWGAAIVGGDLVAAQQVIVTVTAIGSVVAPVRLGGARPGDVLAVSGPLGGAAAGLAALTAGIDPDIDGVAEAVAAYRVPSPSLDLGFDAPATAMTDISDGLVEELYAIARASEVDVEIDRSAVPIHPACADVAKHCGVVANTVTEWAFAGGEDHELLATFAPADVPRGWTVIGDVAAASNDPQVRIAGVDAVTYRGWTSFGRE